MSGWLRRPERDPELGNALREIEAASQFETLDTDSLRRRILAAARPRLAQLGSTGTRWWEWITSWTRIAVPVGLAASLAAGLLVQDNSTASVLSAYSVDPASDSTLVLAAFGEAASGSQLTAGVVGPEGNDWLLEEAVSQ